MDRVVLLWALVWTVVSVSGFHPDPRASKCDVLCNDEASPTSGVCGTDGQLYKNSCDFKNAKCISLATNSTHLYKVSSGPACVTLTSDCDVVSQVRCIHSTPSHTEPVCGSDGKTYDSACSFMSSRCQPASNLTFEHVGRCIPDLTNGARMIDCSQYTIDTTGFAFEDGAHAVLHTIPCPQVANQTVCAFNHRTYRSDCAYCGRLVHLHKIKEGDLKAYIQHDGPCLTTV